MSSFLNMFKNKNALFQFLNICFGIIMELFFQSYYGNYTLRNKLKAELFKISCAAVAYSILCN